MMSKTIFIFSVLLLLGSLSAVATHGVTVRVETDDEPIAVGDEFDLDVYLNLPSGSDTLYEANLRFTRVGANYEFFSLASPNLVGSVFNPLEQNQPSGGAWVMEGNGGGTESFTLTTTQVLLGRIRVSATAPGTISLSLSDSTLVQSYGAPPFGSNHLYTPSLSVESITIGGAAPGCNDATPSACTTQSACTAANNFWSSGTCYNECPAGTSDPDGDRVCTTTPPAGSFSLTSSALANDGNFDVRFTCDADGSGTSNGVNPPLSIANLPAGTQEWVLILEDRSTTPVTPHWILYNFGPSTTTITEGVAASIDPLSQGLNYNGENVYAGPCPPVGDAAHTYVFTVYALDSQLGLSGGATYDDVIAAIDGVTTLGTASLTGMYASGSCPVAMVENGVVGPFPGCEITCNAGFQLEGGMCVPSTTCGNTMVDAGETCSSCPQDVLCGAGESCVAGACIAVPVCGNDLIEGTEQCEGTNLNGNDCTTIPGGFTGGTLGCTIATCQFDTTLCTGGAPAQCTPDDCEIGQACSKETDECVPLDSAALFQQKISTLIQGECYPTRTHSSALYCEDGDPILGTMTTSDGEPDDFRRRVYIIAQTGIALREFFQSGMGEP